MTMSKPTLHLIAARLGCAEDDILQTITDLIASLEEEHALRCQAQTAREAATQEAEFAVRLMLMANAEVTKHQDQNKRLLALLKQARAQALHVPGRTNTKTRCRK
jgi:hypothetical protein